MNYLVSVKDIQVTLNSEEFRDCVGHQLDDRIILPVSSYLVKDLKIFKEIQLEILFFFSDDNSKNIEYQYRQRSYKRCF